MQDDAQELQMLDRDPDATSVLLKGFLCVSKVTHIIKHLEEHTLYLYIISLYNLVALSPGALLCVQVAGSVIYPVLALQNSFV